MTRIAKRTTLAAFVVSFAAFAGLILYLLASRKEFYHPTGADFERVEFGMTYEDVESILGPPHKVLTSESSNKEFYRPDKPGEKVFLYDGVVTSKDGFILEISDSTVKARSSNTATGGALKHRNRC